MVRKIKQKKSKKSKGNIPAMQLAVKKNVTNDLIVSHRINARVGMLEDLVIAFAWMLRLQGKGAVRIRRSIEDLFEMMSDIKIGDLLTVDDIVAQLKIECKLDVHEIISECADRHYQRVEKKKNLLTGSVD